MSVMKPRDNSPPFLFYPVYFSLLSCLLFLSATASYSELSLSVPNAFFSIHVGTYPKLQLRETFRVQSLMVYLGKTYVLQIMNLSPYGIQQSGSGCELRYS